VSAPAVPRVPELIRRADAVLAGTYARPPVPFVAGRGSWLEAEDGRRFLDMTAGIAVNALGHRAPEIAGALREHADGLVHVSNLFHTRPAVELAEALVRRSFAARVFFANSGTEANEGALKFARLRGGADRRDVVYFEGAFHGRTMGALAATDRPDYREPFEPLPGGFRRAPWNDPGGLDAIDGGTAAAIVEPVQGEAGVRVPDPDWLAALRRRCDETGALMVFDEVQCGLGRTGTLWAHEATPVTPDIMTLAKPLAGGLPMGAILLGEEAARAVRPGTHATTFGGGPLVAAVALRVLETVARPRFLAGVRAAGERLQRGLSGLASPFVREIRGRGLMIGVRVSDPAAVREAAFDEQLLVVPAGEDVLRFLPPLNAPGEDLDEAVSRFGRALRRTEGGAS
jgi:predicted acetylornithine/succinylornithine family transaminase